jgi:bacillithiol biosynthesis deacetylase BshB2
MGRNLGNPPFANRVTLPQIRRKELEASCRIIGIQDLRLWGYHDKTIEFEPYAPLDQRILSVIQEIQPDLIFTFYPGYGVHPDHNACGAAVIRTVAAMAPEQRPLILCSAFPTANDLGEPQVVNIIGSFAERKLGALKAHSSQFKYFERELEQPHGDVALKERLGKEVFWVYRHQASDGKQN